MKVIDLLNKIANREEFPNKIKYGNRIYEYEDGYDFVCDNLEHPYFAESYCNDYADLNSEVEIIEEDKKIETINWKSCADNLKDVNDNIDDLVSKINEIIDYINKEK